MHRREAIKRVSAMLGGVALVGGSALWTACSPDRPRDGTSGTSGIGTFTPADIAYLDEIADTILPDTEKSPGAKAAHVGAFLALMVTDCYTTRDQEIFRTGLTQLNQACVTAHATSFVAATPAQRLSLLESVDRDAKAYMAGKTAEQPTHYFRMIKELTLLGFFTSEIGYTKAMRYVESPGRFDPCAPYTKGETTWASHA
ncbi:MAG: gluconate 2-dehydrogenase subunit 3 family protein [Gemmatimonadaceae bacterium]|nr:gluconate 2-dehydrogenase subunit 3 family protein [Gemmatimonadaceae bacterium]